MKRYELLRVNGERGTYRATFAGRDRPGRRPQVMMLFREITDLAGQMVTDHLWFNCTLALQSLDLKIGDRVEFDARVKPYRRPNGRLDYKLSYPTRTRRIEGTQQ